MAGKYGTKDVTVAYDDAPGGTARNVHNFMINGVSIKDIAEIMETTALGDAWKEFLPTGLKSSEQVTIEGLWDTTATTGSHAVFGSVDSDPNQATLRTLTIVFGDSKTYAVETLLIEYEVVSQRGSLQQFRALIQPSGAAAWS